MPKALTDYLLECGLKIITARVIRSSVDGRLGIRAEPLDNPIFPDDICVVADVVSSETMLPTVGQYEKAEYYNDRFSVYEPDNDSGLWPKPGSVGMHYGRLVGKTRILPNADIMNFEYDGSYHKVLLTTGRYVLAGQELMVYGGDVLTPLLPETSFINMTTNVTEVDVANIVALIEKFSSDDIDELLNYYYRSGLMRPKDFSSRMLRDIHAKQMDCLARLIISNRYVYHFLLQYFLNDEVCLNKLNWIHNHPHYGYAQYESLGDKNMVLENKILSKLYSEEYCGLGATRSSLMAHSIWSKHIVLPEGFDYSKDRDKRLFAGIRFMQYFFVKCMQYLLIHDNKGYVMGMMFSFLTQTCQDAQAARQGYIDAAYYSKRLGYLWSRITDIFAEYLFVNDTNKGQDFTMGMYLLIMKLESTLPSTLSKHSGVEAFYEFLLQRLHVLDCTEDKSAALKEFSLDTGRYVGNCLKIKTPVCYEQPNDGHNGFSMYRNR